MKIQILGTRGEIKTSSPYHNKHSGILIDEKILFDLGEIDFLKYNPKYIFITHLHPDHAFFVKNLLRKVPLKKSIYLPEQCSFLPHAKLITETKRINSYKITPIPTNHSLKVKSQAYLIETRTEKILYTGDLISIDKKYHNLLQNTTMVITEGSYFRRNGLIKVDYISGKLYGHTGIPNLMEFFCQFTHHILLVHFGSWFFKDIKLARQKIQMLAKKYNIVAIIGYDGMDIDTNRVINQ